MAQIFHVLPINDLAEHYEDQHCICEPRIEEGGRLVIHNSFDGREEWEDVGHA